MQQLMTEEIAKTVPRLYGQDGAEDPTVYAHYFSCVNGWDWWLLEFDGTDEAFGLVEGYDDELGYFSIKEMAELNRQMGFAAVERDEHFSPKPLSAQATAKADGCDALCAGAKRVVTLVTCSANFAGGRARTLTVFVG